MYDIIKQVINGKSYELTSMLRKINTLWAESAISDEQRVELIECARENADPENSYAPLQAQIDNIALEINELIKEVALLKNGEFSDVNIEEYPEYVQPTGGHNTYNIGDKITHKGKKYECLVDNCVWSPNDYPQGWKEVAN